MLKKSTQFDFSKLIGRMAEKGVFRKDLAKMLGISEHALRQKMTNERYFRSEEMLKICNFLDIPLSEVAVYFLTEKVPNLEPAA